MHPPDPSDPADVVHVPLAVACAVPQTFPRRDNHRRPVSHLLGLSLPAPPTMSSAHPKACHSLPACASHFQSGLAHLFLVSSAFSHLASSTPSAPRSASSRTPRSRTEGPATSARMPTDTGCSSSDIRLALRRRLPPVI
ncbi:hypothetical protein HYPSUDRAFT_201876 [Hypholoma sublateritium FD-334 SS-4]|uniref:Uncharacterized protein n=1 Tax=Hypholoma sublateritium (strain FD-334 SS-4) TaxID=945553 RepID=A0A0D2L6Z4_HYPSF|nr:hypothetical protein HYPSUDRAFT_201876 [Hypholoma sublateritium FD-334 SS-4]